MLFSLLFLLVNGYTSFQSLNDGVNGVHESFQSFDDNNNSESFQLNGSFDDSNSNRVRNNNGVRNSESFQSSGSFDCDNNNGTGVNADSNVEANDDNSSIYNIFLDSTIDLLSQPFCYFDTDDSVSISAASTNSAFLENSVS